MVSYRSLEPNTVIDLVVSPVPVSSKQDTVYFPLGILEPSSGRVGRFLTWSWGLMLGDLGRVTYWN